MNLTHNNYFTTTGNGDEWTVHLKPCTNYENDNYYRECIRAAKLIENESTKEIVLMFSGGIDGEFMLNIFKDANIHFKVAMISYGNWNTHDSKYAYDYCNKHGINPKIIEVDLTGMIARGDIYEIAEIGKCCAPQMIGVMQGLSQIDGTIVMANGEPQVDKDNNGDWKWCETERINSYMNWYTHLDIEGTPDFLRYTPEQTVSFLEEPLIKKLVNNEFTQTKTVGLKHELYNQYFDQVKRNKYTGWEYLERSDLYQTIYEKFYTFRQRFNGHFELGYNDILSQLKGTSV